jgi:phosphate starvation-inducible membrane PsiE
MGTDGLWDNTYDDEILKIVGDNYDASPQIVCSFLDFFVLLLLTVQIAKKIAQTTFDHSNDKNRYLLIDLIILFFLTFRLSPFGNNVIKAFPNGDVDYEGGKPDGMHSFMIVSI